MLLPNRHGAADTYRYGFNGMEKDDELKGEGNSLNTEFRQYDPRLGKWLSLDPLMAKYPFQSPYAGFNNNPIYFADPSGLEGDPPVKTIRDKDGRVVAPNGKSTDFADDWYSVVNGNLVMSNGYHYLVWNSDTGKYEKGRAPKTHKVTMPGYDERQKNGQYAHIGNIEDLQVGDVVEEYLNTSGGGGMFIGYGLAYTPNDHQDFTYLGGDNLIKTKDFTGLDYAEYLSYVFPIGGGYKGGTKLLQWLSKTKAVSPVIKVVQVIPKTFKAFTKSNYRYNLQVLTGKLGIGMDAHHIFPQAQRFLKHWKRAKINIHDPSNMSWWQLNAHRKAAAQYNKAWDQFFDKFPQATREQIQSFGNSLMKKYGF